MGILLSWDSKNINTLKSIINQFFSNSHEKSSTLFGLDGLSLICQCSVAYLWL